MVCLGIGLFGDEYSSLGTPSTGVLNINALSMDDFMADNIYITKDVNKDMSILDWDYNTIMYSDFNGNTIAGNVEFTIGTISDLFIKKRKVGDTKWQVVYHKKIETQDDFYINEQDFTSIFKETYEYALVGSLNGVDGNYHVKEILSDSDSFYIIDKNGYFGTVANQGSCDTYKKDAGFYVETMYSKYPTKMRNSDLNYYTGTMSGLFIKFNSDTCQFETKNLQKYRKEVIDFLSNGNQKLLKTEDGRMWLISIDAGSISDVKDSHPDFRLISFAWTEIGNCESNKDLYYAGLTDVTSEYWG